MKFIQVLASVAVLLFYSCNNADNTSSQSEEKEKEKNITTRDISITRSNAYNDLFLDTAAVEKFITDKKLSDSIARRVRSFYNARNFEYAWFSSTGLTEQARCFWNQHDYVTTYGNDSTLKDKALQKKMDRLIAEDTLIIGRNDKSYQSTELTLTSHFIQYILNTYEKGYVKRKEVERFIPAKKTESLSLADSLLNKKHKDDKYYEDVNELYGALKNQLQLYYQIAKQGGWPTITAGKKPLKKGHSGPEIAVIKKRLQLTHDMAAGDSSNVFTDTLENGVKNFEQRHGYTPDGIITADLIEQMNVPVLKRIQQILINMDRMRWMPHQPQGTLITVNIPEFVLHVTDGKNKVFDMPVVVGKEGHSTMMFNGDLNQVVFSPYWNVPPSIVKKEILPAMEKDPDYLESKHMEITGNEDGLPDIRQKPGPDNALGRVKFLFPNSFNIYFHDTPEKGLFAKDKRAYSHGCIRLSDPVKMANWLLESNPEWTPDKIEEAMNSGNEKYVKIKKPVPVIITYYTAWVDENGQLNFRDDIYGHDAAQIEKLFIAGR